MRGQRCCVCDKPSRTSNCDTCREIRAILARIHRDVERDENVGRTEDVEIERARREAIHRKRSRMVSEYLRSRHAKPMR